MCARRAILTLVRPDGELPCPCCLISYERLFQGSPNYALRSKDKMKLAYEQSLSRRPRKARQKFMKNLGLRAVYVSFDESVMYLTLIFD